MYTYMLYVHKVPGPWVSAWRTNKTLDPWFADVVARTDQLRRWSADLGVYVIAHEIICSDTDTHTHTTHTHTHIHVYVCTVMPPSLWLSGTFNPMAFITAVMQTTARKRGWALDNVVTFTDPTTMDWVRAGACLHACRSISPYPVFSRPHTSVAGRAC